MAIDVSLTNITSGYNTNKINTNFTTISTALQNALSRNGTSPNQMTSDFDLNGYDLLNIGNLSSVLTSVQMDWKGAWTTATAYIVNQAVESSGNSYICIVAHTSNNFATDLSASKWELMASQGATGPGTGDMLAANDLSDVVSAINARANLGLVIGTNVLGDVVDDVTPQSGGPHSMNSFSLMQAKGVDVASGSELLVLTGGNYFDVTGTTTVTSIENTANVFDIGSYITLHFTGVLTLTHNASSLILPNSANIITTAGDQVSFVKFASGSWRCVNYFRVNGAASIDDPWASQPIGVPIPTVYSTADITIPPKNKYYRYVLLTAGQDGIGGYNEGIVNNESLVGSAPTITATFTINLAASILNGTVVRLLNTEQRFLRGATSPNVTQDSANLLHGHPYVYSVTNDFDGGSAGAWVMEDTGVVSKASYTGSPQAYPTGDRQIGGDGGSEARPRNMSVNYYMRVL